MKLGCFVAWYHVNDSSHAATADPVYNMSEYYIMDLCYLVVFSDHVLIGSRSY